MCTYENWDEATCTGRRTELSDKTTFPKKSIICARTLQTSRHMSMDMHKFQHFVDAKAHVKGHP